MNLKPLAWRLVRVNASAAVVSDFVKGNSNSVGNFYFTFKLIVLGME